MYRRYDNISKILENANINLQSQNNKLNEISNRYKIFYKFINRFLKTYFGKDNILNLW